MDGGGNLLVRLIDHPWISRAGNVSFLVGSAWSILKLAQGSSINTLALLLIVMGLLCMGIQLFPRGPEFASDASESNVFTGSKAKIKLKGEWAPISFRLVGLPLYNYARSPKAAAKEVTAVVAVFKPPGKVLLDRAHGLWRESEGDLC